MLVRRLHDYLHVLLNFFLHSAGYFSVYRSAHKNFKELTSACPKIALFPNFRALRHSTRYSGGGVEHCMIHDFSWRLMSSIFPLTQQIAASLENLSIYKLHNVCIVGTPPSSIEYSLNNAKWWESASQYSNVCKKCNFGEVALIEICNSKAKNKEVCGNVFKRVNVREAIKSFIIKLEDLG